MKITDVKLTPVYSRRETGNYSPHVILQLMTDEGLMGLGEMSDLGHTNTRWDLADLKASIAYLLNGRNPLDYGPLAKDARVRFPEGGPLCEGIEIAIFDLVGKYNRRSVAEVLGGCYRDRIRVCYPIFPMRDMTEVEGNIRRAEKRLREGQDMFRLYCGLNVDADEAFLRALRAQWGGKFALKSLDFSARLPWKRTLAALERLLPYEPILIESVSDRRDPGGHYEVRRRVSVPVSEHISSPDMALDFAKHHYVDIFNVSLADAGGFTNARRIADIALAAGISCLVGTTQELSIGVAAQAMFGATLENLDYPSDMTGGLLYEDDVVVERVQYEQGHLLVPKGPGIGMQLDEAKLAALKRPLSSLPFRP